MGLSSVSPELLDFKDNNGQMFKYIIKTKDAIKGAYVYLKAYDDLVDYKPNRALERHNSLDAKYFKLVNFCLLHAGCYLGVDDLNMALKKFEDAKVLIEKSKCSEIDKEYLSLYSKFMIRAIKAKSRECGYCNVIREQARKIQEDVSPRWLRQFPIH